MRVDYYGGLLKVASEFICFEHEGFAQGKAFQWWKRRKRDYDPLPESVNHALEMVGKGIGIRSPQSILVTKSKYPEILNYGWD